MYAQIVKGSPSLTVKSREGLTEKALQKVTWRMSCGYFDGQGRKEISKQNEKHKYMDRVT